jgi:hypothetical protein
MSASSAVIAIPDEFLCPITGEIMTDPVNVCAEGHIFERSAINQWSAQGRNNCPTCRTPLGSHRPERHLKQAIVDWLCAHPQGGPALGLAPFHDGAISALAEIFNEGGHNYLNITVSTDSSAGKQGGLIIIGLDNSGSMGDLTDPDNKEIFYTRMDLAKHTINAVAAMLGPEYFLAVVSFSTAAKIVLEPTQMNDAGRGKLKAVLQTVQPDAMTNIDAAIRAMMSIANRPEMKGRAIFGALLTDGAETVTPSPSGTVKALSRLEMTNPWIFSTFGFGYDLNSVLLTQLSEMSLAGGGSFGFIPDLTMIGTVFINWIANCMMMGTRDAIIQYSVNSGSPVSIHTGPLAIGQPRDYLVQIPAGASVKVFAGGAEIVPSHPASVDEFALARHLYIAAMEQAIAVSEAGRSDGAFPFLAKVVARFADSKDSRVKALLLDIESADPSEGQIGMAARYWKRWGAHYMRSYRRAQQIERRLNFKDPGSLIYGGDEASPFGQCVVKGEELFMTLEPPQPTGSSRGYGSSSSSAPPAYDPAYLSAYISQQSQAAQSGGCFHPETPVVMGDGSVKQIQSLSPEDLVWTPEGAASVIALVTIGHGSATSVMMSKVGDCLLTPYHPYLDANDVWVLGSDTVGQESYPTGTVYNLVLDKGHIIRTAGGVRACTLAHGFKGPVIEHAFFGTQAVLDCLALCPGWLKGHPFYKNLQTRRENGVIVEWFDTP